MVRAQLFRWISRFWPGHSGGEPRGVDLDHLAALLASPSPTILEIGAHDGTHTCQFLQLFATPTVHCFEPEPRALTRLQQSVSGRNRVHIHPVAVGSRSGKAHFHRSSGNHPGPNGRPMPQGWDYSGSLRPPSRHLELYPAVKFESTLEVDVVTIDDWIRGQSLETIDLVWMDVQGAEGDVFRGMVNTLPRVRFIYTEYSNEELYEGQPNLEQLLALLPDFEVIEQYQQDVLLQRRRPQPAS